MENDVVIKGTAELQSVRRTSEMVKFVSDSRAAVEIPTRGYKVATLIVNDGTHERKYTVKVEEITWP